MSGIAIFGENTYGDKSISLNLNVLQFKDDDTFLAYLPSMDLTGYGNTEAEAISSLHIVLDEFFKYTVNKKTLTSEMQRLGWKIKKPNKPMLAPQMSELIPKNLFLKEIIDNKQFTSSTHQVNIPAFV